MAIAAYGKNVGIGSPLRIQQSCQATEVQDRNNSEVDFFFFFAYSTNMIRPPGRDRLDEEACGVDAVRFGLMPRRVYMLLNLSG